MKRFIDENRNVYGVEPICKVLPIAPSTYYAQRTREVNPDKQPARAQRDARLRVQIRALWEENYHVYGARKVWRQLQRDAVGDNAFAPTRSFAAVISTAAR
jgi:putative transposase